MGMGLTPEQTQKLHLFQQHVAAQEQWLEEHGKDTHMEGEDQPPTKFPEGYAGYNQGEFPGYGELQAELQSLRAHNTEALSEHPKAPA